VPELAGKGVTMAKFMCTHTVPAGAMTREQVNEIAELSQKDPDVKGYCSFLNLTEGKLFCVFEGPDEKTVANWFGKMQLPYDSITLVEIEGQRGKMTDVAPSPEHAAI
jgi:hypothetical protein